jgi:hypothetical protein
VRGIDQITKSQIVTTLETDEGRRQVNDVCRKQGISYAMS